MFFFAALNGTAPTSSTEAVEVDPGAESIAGEESNPEQGKVACVSFNKDNKI